MITGTFASKKITSDRTPRLNSIVDQLIAGEATPFVGAGVSANNLNGSDEYSQVIALIRDEIDEMMGALGKTGRFEPHESLETFVRVFQENYVDGRECNKLKGRDKAEDDEEDEGGTSKKFTADCFWFQHAKLRKFRAHLAELIVHLTRRYNEQVAERNQYYFSNFNPVDYSDKLVLKGEFAAAKTMASLRAIKDEISRANSQDTAEKLQLKVATRLFIGAFKWLSERYNPNTGERRSLKLHVDHLIWLTDLLWLTFAIWLPLHPTSRELAAELSFVSDRKTRTSERRMVRAAECFSDPEELSAYMSDRFEKDQESLLREALIMDSHWALASMALIKPNDHVRSAKMLFTTNFDRGIEDALESLILSEAKSTERTTQTADCYRLVFPVLVENSHSVLDLNKRKHGPYFDLCWAVCDWSCDDKGNASREMRWVLDNNTKRYNSPRQGLEKDTQELKRLKDLFIDEDVVISEDFGGPIIVKFHGAPLERFDSSLHSSDLPRDPELRHYLVVSEHQYIDTIIRSGETSPPWLMNALTERDISFLGYSIEDWNVRLHLAKQPSRSNGMQNGPETGKDGEPSMPLSRSAIVRGASDAERTLFERLGIGLASSDLGLLVREIKNNSNFKSAVKNSVFNKSNRNYLDALTLSG